MYVYFHLLRVVAISPACICRILYELLIFNIHLVLYRPPSSLKFDGEVYHRTLAMSSHAPGEGGKNAPVQITEGPSIIPAIRRRLFRAGSCRCHCSDLDTHFPWPPPSSTRHLLFNSRFRACTLLADILSLDNSRGRSV